jgi:CDP-diacylglycerol--inositol 3-phosphatidyltransferase
VHSRSRLVRLYYSNRLFMGFCCVCCEVAYLALFLLHVPAYRTARPWLLPLRLPAAAAAAVSAAAGGGWGAYLPAALPTVAREWAGAGVPLLGLVVLAALPGVLVKQACNWVQLRAAVAGLVEHDVRGMSSSSSGAAAQRHAPSARVKAQ